MIRTSLPLAGAVAMLVAGCGGSGAGPATSAAQAGYHDHAQLESAIREVVTRRLNDPKFLAAQGIDPSHPRNRVKTMRCVPRDEARSTFKCSARLTDGTTISSVAHVAPDGQTFRTE